MPLHIMSMYGEVKIVELQDSNSGHLPRSLVIILIKLSQHMEENIK